MPDKNAMNPGIKLHKQLAMGREGLPDTDFGVEKFGSKTVNGPGPKAGYLKDSERAARPPIDGNQANPDHGWHK